MKNNVFELTTKASAPLDYSSMTPADAMTAKQYAPFIFVCGADDSTFNIEAVYEFYLNGGRDEYGCESLAEFLDCITDMGSFTWTARSLREYLYLIGYQIETGRGYIEVPHDETIRAYGGR